MAPKKAAGAVSAGAEGTPEPLPTVRKRKNAKKEPDPPPVVVKEEEHIVLQLAISEERVQSILKENSEMLNPLAYCHTIIDPEPYMPTNNFISDNDAIAYIQREAERTDVIETPTEAERITTNTNSCNCCFWCCHQIVEKTFGMPIKYDTIHDTFTTFGSFCSLECVTAHNYAHYMGSDRMWEIHSWIQWMAHKMGYETPIRPAPSRFLLKMFNGSMEIEEFRDLHKNYLKTYIMNMPPLIHVQGQIESINTSYLNQKTQILTTTNHTSSTTAAVESNEKVKLARNKGVVDIRKTLDSKMNLIIKTKDNSA